MNCPSCTEGDVSGYYASTDQLWCEFEAEVVDHCLYTIYYCRHCDWQERKKFDPQLIHDKMKSEEEE